MLIKKVELKDFLCHERLTVEFSSGINLILGENGIGKTSIIEGIYYGLFTESTKDKKKHELKRKGSYGDPRIYLETDLFSVYRYLFHPNEDFLGNIKGRQKVNQYISERLGISKEIFRDIAYASQGEILTIVDLTPSQKESLLNKIFSLSYITDFHKNLKSIMNFLAGKRTSLMFTLAQLEQGKKERLKDIEREIKWINENLKEIERDIERLEREKEKYVAFENYRVKRELVEKAWILKRKIFDYRRKKALYEKINKMLFEIKENKMILENEIRNIEKRKNDFLELINKGICPKCGRPIEDKTKYVKEIENFEIKLALLKEKISNIRKEYNQYEKQLKVLYSELVRTNESKLLNEYLSLRKKVLEFESFSKLKKLISEKVEMEFESVVFHLDNLYKQKEELEKRLLKLDSEKQAIKFLSKEKRELIEKEIEELGNDILALKKASNIISDEMIKEIKYNIIKQTNIERLFNVFGLGKLEIDKNLEFYINGLPWYLASGSQQIALGITIRIALLNLFGFKLMILDEPTIHLDEKRISLLQDLLVLAKELFEQIIIISHEKSFEKIADRIIHLTRKGVEYY